jgi:hypothetical protein
MRSEEKLNELFKTLREENVTTSVSDVSSWINAYSTSANIKTVKKTPIIKKIIIMSAIITTAIVGSIILFSGEHSKQPKIINSIVRKERANVLSFDSSKSKKNKTIQEKFSWSKNQSMVVSKTANLKIDSTYKVEEKNTNDEKLNNNISSNEAYPQSSIEKNLRFWKIINDSLNVDTLFNGVKSLVFTGDNCDLSVRGSKRSDIRMNFHYLLKTKGIFLRKKNPELSYELKDSVLTVHLEIKNQIFIGVGSTSETSKLEFNVPENIGVSINTSYSDVELNNLSNNNYLIQTTSGDIKTERVNGNINLTSSYGDVSIKNSEINNLGNNNYYIQTTSGDIKMERVNGNVILSSSSGDVSLKNVLGKIDISVSSGDIVGNNLSVLEALEITCSHGDVYCMITNPTSELMFNLFTKSGELKILKQDLIFRGEGLYTFGKGNVKITVKSTSGNIIIR